MEFKQSFLEDLILTYSQADEIRVYEDRVKHVKHFREFFEQLNRRFQTAQNPSPRKAVNAEVIQVAEGAAFLSPVIETAEVQRMINSHNDAVRNRSGNGTKSPYGPLCIKRTIFYTGYLISNADSSRLISQTLNPMLPSGLADSNDLKYMANSILITPRPAPRSILDKVGGLGKKLKWKVTGTAVFEHRVWAARLTPVPATEKYYTENPQPVVVLAVRKDVIRKIVMKTLPTQIQAELARKAHQEGQHPTTHGMVAAIITKTVLAVADHIVDVDVGPVLEVEGTQTEGANVAEAVGATPDLPKAIDR
ncbi:hypothetical protein APSETT445_007587 [Aspergillus pseudonomiae]